MDRFQKCVEIVRSKWREFVKKNWHNLPEDDNFRLFDVVLMVGAIRSKTLTRRWQIICWKIYKMQAQFQYLMTTLNFIDHVFSESDFGKVVWYTTVFVASTICLVQQVVLNRHFESIQTARDFINSKPAGSGDQNYDAKLRKKLFQCCQFIAITLLIVACLDFFAILFHTAGIAVLFESPRVIRFFGPRIASVTQFMYTFVLWPIWCCKSLAEAGLMYALLQGFKTEFNIFVHGFEHIWNRVQGEVDENLPTSSADAIEDQPALLRLRHEQRDTLSWKYMQKHVKTNIMKHIEIVENLRLLKPVITWLFFTTYYFALIAVSPLIYVVLYKGLSGGSAVLAMGIGCLFLQCYMWCSQIESFPDINDKMEGSITELLVMMPHSKQHHSDYKGMRATLLIMKMNVRSSCQFTCGGVFDINVRAVTELLDISYSVLNFLLSVAKIKGH